MILLNLDNAPGRGTDHTPPATPVGAVKKLETWNGESGVAVRWEPNRDHGLISQYAVFRDGRRIGYVVIGTFYFDPGASPDERYKIVAVDGDGNRSTGSAPGSGNQNDLAYHASFPEQLVRVSSLGKRKSVRDERFDFLLLKKVQQRDQILSKH